jgi:methionyl-tRNA synthetase
MESRQFSTSRGVVIYVRDMLQRYQADALRYYICAAGPETSDSDFTWADFVRRTNGELVAGWGNLVNRTATMVHRGFGRIPAPTQLVDADRALLDEVERGFDTVGGSLERHRFRQGITEAMRLVGEVNRYVTEQEPYKLKEPADRERLATILYVTAQAVSDCNTLLSPFLPHSANTIDRVLGGAGDLAPMPRIDEVDDVDGGPAYPIITGDYDTGKRWERRPLRPGVPIGPPTPVFTKLDPSLVESELAVLGTGGPG